MSYPKKAQDSNKIDQLVVPRPFEGVQNTRIRTCTHVLFELYEVQDEVGEEVGVRVWGDCKAIFFQLLYCNAKTTALVWNKRS